MSKLRASQKGFASVLILLILLIGIVATVYLVKRPQIFKPKAAGGPESYACKFAPKQVNLANPCTMWGPVLGGKQTGGEKGYTRATITCQDGVTQERGDGNFCASETSWNQIAQNMCNNHSSCPAYNISSDPRTSLSVTDKGDGSAELLFVEQAAAGIGPIHTAVWEGAINEDQAKKDGTEGIYQGFGAGQGKRVVKMPAYIEYLAVDAKGQMENTHKRVISPSSFVLEVIQTFDAGSEPLKALLAVSLDGVSADEIKGDSHFFRYLTADQHTLTFYLPPSVSVSAQLCSATCSAVYPQFDSSSTGLFGTIRLSFATMGTPIKLTMKYTSVAGSVPQQSAPPIPITQPDQDSGKLLRLNPTTEADCKGGKLRISWNRLSLPGVKYHVRGRKTTDQNYMPDVNWTAGVAASDIITNGAGEDVECGPQTCSYVAPITPGAAYKIWVDYFSPEFKGNNAYVDELAGCTVKAY